MTATPRLPTPTRTPVPTRTETPTPTTEPTLTPAATATVAPTPTLNQALADLGYCRRSFGPTDAGRFSARLLAIEASRLDLVDRVTLTFSDTQGLLHGRANCLEGAQWATLTGMDGMDLPGENVLALDLDGWAHDEVWLQSPITQTQALTGTLPSGQVFDRVSFASDQFKSRGTTIGIGLRRPVPFRVRLEEQPTRIIVEVDRSARVEPQDDPLAQPEGRTDAPDRPIFFLQNYDVWRLAGGRAQPLTTTAELETALAIAPDGDTLAVCRASADAEPAALPYDVRASLWVLDADGNEQRLLADVGGCADLRFAPSGKTLAFTANTAAAPPAILSVWTVPLVVGEPRPATPIADEWNRYGAEWLPDSRLIYHARNGSGFSVLFIRDEDGTEREVSARLLTGPTYRGVGQFVVGDDLVAVEALRAGEEGADLAFLRFDGTEVGARERRGFWQRPLAFLPDGLLYLSTECPSNLVQQYTLRRRQPDGTVEDLVTGRSLAGLGEVTTSEDAVLLTRIDQPQPGLRGAQALPSDESQASLWAMSGDASARRELYRAVVPILNIRSTGNNGP
ncbi:MAG: hypothetical protein M3380_08715 [Chloroflexota bacterium]|nr:hypothetical protein [Chloroflexota bacterium]